MGITSCPKCGRVQDTARECRWCGLVFERYHQERRLTGDTRRSREVARRTAQIARWAALACLALSALLVLHQSQPPPVESAPQAADAARAKITGFRGAAGAVRPRVLRLDEAELNGWLSASLVQDPAADTEGRHSNVKDLRVQLLDSEIRLYVVFEYRGKDFSLELQGRLQAENGYLGLEPTAGKLGALPLPPPTLRSAIHRIAQSAENREKFRLPPDVEDIRVERRQVVVTAR